MKSLAKFMFGTAAALATVGTAQAQDLFIDLAQDEVITPAEFRSKEMFRSRQVKLDISAASLVFDKSAPAETLSIELFPGMEAKMTMTDFDRSIGDGAVAWAGQIEGVLLGQANMVYRDGSLSGHFQMDGSTYTIRPKGDGVHEIGELDLSTLPNEAPEMSPPVAAMDAPQMAYSSPWSPRLRVLFIYTADAKAGVEGEGSTMRDEGLMAISMANTGLANTALTGQRFKFAGARKTYCPYDENAGAYSDLLNEVTDTSTCLGARVLTLRNQYGADLVAVIRKSSGSTSCGVGWLLTNGGPESYGYSVTSRFCIPGHTVTHEMGHNIGLHHDRYVVSSTPAGTYNYGLAIPNASDEPFSQFKHIRSIMAYNNACSDIGVSCARQNMFTNTHPNGYAGAPFEQIRLGKGSHSPQAAVNRKKILDNWNSIAAFR